MSLLKLKITMLEISITIGSKHQVSLVYVTCTKGRGVLPAAVHSEGGVIIFFEFPSLHMEQPEPPRTLQFIGVLACENAVTI